MTPAPASDPFIALWRAAGFALTPAVRLWLRRRAARGKEDAARLDERFGVPGLPRPDGPLVWLHGASVGESSALLPLVKALLAGHPSLHALVTTGTVTSARLLAGRLPPRAIHQYAPVDLPGAVRRFVSHWRPDLVIWTESELWPGLLAGAAAAPLVMVNGRLSERSVARWRRAAPLIRSLLARFSLLLAQSEADARRFRALGAEALYLGNLKFAGAPLPVDPAALGHLQSQLGDRPRWVAASTHPGEEEIVAAAHRPLAARHPRLLTLLVPRHPERGQAVAAALRAAGLRVALRSAGAAPDRDVDVYVGDTLGELGLFYRLGGIAFVGGSLVPVRGHNLVEPAQLGCAILHGPSVENHVEVAAALAAAGAAVTVDDGAALAAALDRLLGDAAARQRMGAAAAAALAGSDRVLERVLAALAPFLPCGR